MADNKDQDNWVPVEPIIGQPELKNEDNEDWSEYYHDEWPEVIGKELEKAFTEFAKEKVEEYEQVEKDFGSTRSVKHSVFIENKAITFGSTNQEGQDASPGGSLFVREYYAKSITRGQFSTVGHLSLVREDSGRIRLNSCWKKDTAREADDDSLSEEEIIGITIETIDPKHTTSRIKIDKPDSHLDITWQRGKFKQMTGYHKDDTYSYWYINDFFDGGGIKIPPYSKDMVDIEFQLQENKMHIKIFKKESGVRSRAIDSIVIPLNDDPDLWLKNLLNIDKYRDATELLTDPFNVPAGHADYGWLHGDLLRAVGVKWEIEPEKTANQKNPF